jgi:two-component system chemotaxis response regulator CheY
MTVLVVDDSKVMRMKLKGIIVSAGVPVTAIREAGHGLEALAVFDAEPVDIVFTDINMPEMDGRELLRQLSQRTFPKPVYRVVCTTETPGALRDELSRYGVDLYIEKPFSAEAVQQLLSKVSGL